MIDEAELHNRRHRLARRSRKARAGALLCPQGLSDGELIGIARLPRSLVGEPINPGRAHLRLGDGSLLTLTVPRAG